MAERFAWIFVGVAVTLIVGDVYRQAATRLGFIVGAFVSYADFTRLAMLAAVNYSCDILPAPLGRRSGSAGGNSSTQIIG